MALGPFAAASGLETVREVIRSLEPVGAVDDGEFERVHAKDVAVSRPRWIDWEDRRALTIRDAAAIPAEEPRPRIAAGMILAAMRAAAEVVEAAELHEMPIDYRLAALTRAFDLLEPSLSNLIAVVGLWIPPCLGAQEAAATFLTVALGWRDGLLAGHRPSLSRAGGRAPRARVDGRPAPAAARASSSAKSSRSSSRSLRR